MSRKCMQPLLQGCNWRSRCGRPLNQLPTCLSIIKSLRAIARSGQQPVFSPHYQGVEPSRSWRFHFVLIEFIKQGKDEHTGVWIKNKAGEHIKNVTKTKFLVSFIHGHIRIALPHILINQDTSRLPVEQSKMINYIGCNWFLFGKPETLHPDTNNRDSTFRSFCYPQGVTGIMHEMRKWQFQENYHTCWVGRFPKCPLRK